MNSFDQLCRYIDLTQKEKKSLALIVYHSANILNELIEDLKKKFSKLNKVEIKATQLSTNFAETLKLINTLSSGKTPELLIVEGAENVDINVRLIDLAKEFACPVLIFLPQDKMSLLLQRSVNFSVAGFQYFKF